MITSIDQGNRTLTIRHGREFKVTDISRTLIEFSYKDSCNTCDPYLYKIQGEGDLYIEVSHKAEY